MMADREISQEELENLVEDAAYLQDEAEAMQYVIDDVPYNESPPEGQSIAEMLLLIDHAQVNYYRPILEEATDNTRPTHLEDFEHFKDTFEPDEERLKDVQKILRKLAKHRAGMANAIKNTPLIDWETIIYENDKQVLLFDFIKGMIRFEREILKKIADQILVFNQEKERNRELNQRRSHQRGGQAEQNLN
jgi:hypothetical protein